MFVIAKWIWYEMIQGVLYLILIFVLQHNPSIWKAKSANKVFIFKHLINLVFTQTAGGMRWSNDIWLEVAC